MYVHTHTHTRTYICTYRVQLVLRAPKDSLSTFYYKGLLGGQVVKALDDRPRDPRFQSHYSNRDFFT